jgi:hypothetical protein
VHFFVFKEWGKAIEFANNFYLQYFVVPVALFLVFIAGCSKLMKKYKKNKFVKSKYSRFAPLIAAALVFVLILFLKPTVFSKLLAGFGSLIPSSVVGQTIGELQKPKFSDFWEGYWILILLSFAGFVPFFKEFESKKLSFLCFLIITMYMAILAMRYIYLMSIPFIALSGVFLVYIGRSKKIALKNITILLIVLLFLLGVGRINSVFGPFLGYDVIPALEYFKDNSENKSCLVTGLGYGSQVQYFAKRHSYTSSVSQDAARIKKTYEFFLTDRNPDFGELDNLYVLAPESYLIYIHNLVKISGVEGIKLSYRKQGYNCSYNSTKWGMLWLSDDLCKSNMIKMLKGQEIDGLEKIYVKDGNAIYKVQEK